MSFYDYDNSDFSVPSTSNSHLLSESPLYSDTGPAGDELSLSELSIADRTLSAFSKPFTLLAPARSTDHDDDVQPEVGDDENLLPPEEIAEGSKKAQKEANEKRREEKLRSDLFILKKLNAAFAMYNEALDESASANERVAAQLSQTDALLNKYIDILSKSEEFSRLILDEQWMGAEADEEQLEREEREAQEKARREAEERVLAEQRERERQAREERERLEREEKERVERERQERSAARGVVRGSRARASTRGVRGTTRGALPGSSTATSSSRLRAPSSGVSIPQSGSGTKRHTATASTGIPPSMRGSSRRI